MVRKIFTGTVTVAIIIMLICISLVMGVVYNYLGAQIDSEMRNEACMIEAGLELEGKAYLDKLKAKDELKSRLTIIGRDGLVLYDNKADQQVMENHLDREEVQEAIEKGEGYAVRTSSTLSISTRYYARAFDDEYILRVATSQYSHMDLLADTAGLMVTIGGILLILCILISRYMAVHIVKPINDIDLRNPNVEENYEEIAPLLHRIHHQNAKINRNIEILRRQKDEFGIIIENMSEGLLIIDDKKEVLTYNGAAIKILGAKVPEGEGRDGALSVFSLNRSETFRKVVEEALVGSHSERDMAIGTDTYVLMGNPVFDQGAVTGAVIVMLDVTEKQVGERLRREFTSNVSHELKTPLTSIYGVSDMLASGIVKAEDVGHFALTIKEESARLISLIDDIMKISRMDEGTAMGEKELVDLSEIAGAVVERLRTKSAQANVQLRLNCEPAKVYGIDYILDEIVYNLVENAIKYNKPGGRVTVTCEKQLGNAVLRVADTGIGIPKEELDRVFERFYRVDKSHNKDIPGTGLGLSIVKHGVAFHDGEIMLDSSAGVGTTVVVKLPGAE